MQPDSAAPPPPLRSAWPPWVERLRWALALGLTAAWAAGSATWEAALPALMWALLGNGILRARPNGEATALLLVLLGDNAALGWLLAQTGGPANPFSTLYLVNISLAALLLPPLGLALVGTTAAAAYGLLFRLVDMASLHGPGKFEDHLRGMWLSFFLSGLLIGGFVFLTRRALQRAQEEVARLRDHGARMDRLAALSTLAAGAAHELGTPLSTIRAASRELERSLADAPTAHEFMPELAAIRASVERCREILTRLSRSGGQHAGETLERVPLGTVWQRAADLLAVDAARVDAALPSQAAVFVPPVAAVETVKNVVRNALEAAPAPARVAVSAAEVRGGWEVVVVDTGPGIPPAILTRLGEPFVTGKPDGMGLGLYLADQLCRQVGGELRIEPQPQRGTRVVLRWPVA